MLYKQKYCFTLKIPERPRQIVLVYETYKLPGLEFNSFNAIKVIVKEQTFITFFSTLYP